jgi:acyl-CoA synthetase (AMP-forming)/AMP-acid ligase II
MRQLDDAQCFLPEIWSGWARHRGARVAVTCGADRRDWRGFNAAMNRVAHTLAAGGDASGRRVAVLMGNGIETLAIMFGVVKAGASVVPLSVLLTGPQLAGLIDDSGAETVFVGAEQRALIEPYRHLAPCVRRWLACGFAGDGWSDARALVEAAADTDPSVTFRQDQEFNIIYSSGTTGLPKGIAQTHRARLHWSFSNAVEMGFTAQSRVLTTSALFSNGTWLMLLPALFVGAALRIMPAFNGADFLAIVARERITHSFMVPTQYAALLETPGLDGADLSSLRCVLTAGSPLSAAAKREVLRRVTPNLYELYGFSEGFATMLKPHEHADKFDSVGTPVLGFELRIIDEDGHAAAPGAVGEIAGYGAGLMRGYHQRPDQTADLIWLDERGRSFVRSGDLGRVDEDGYLFLAGRKKDMIISGGFNVFPADVEAILRGHDAVRDVAVIGVPHPLWGEQCLALVIPRADVPADAEALRDWGNARLSKTQRLVAVEFRAEFPRNALGKVMKPVLRAPYWPKE